MLDTQETDDDSDDEQKRAKKRCSECPRMKDRKTNHVCSRCENYFCRSHYIEFKICKVCYNSIHNDNLTFKIAKSDFPANYLRYNSN